MGAETCFARQGPCSQICVANADGTGEQLLVPDDNYNQRFCQWSADGEWISYRHSRYDVGVGLWLVHPDGTNNHPIVFSEVEGYPGYQVNDAEEHGWAPDGQRLVTTFAAQDFSGDVIKGLGVVSRDGGVLKPVLITATSLQCCADVHIPYWSPDGTRIVFSAALEAPPGPENTRTLVKEVELWMINADGSGNPVRLTNDHIFESYVTWWAPAVFTDVHKGNWAYSAINTCEQAGFVKGYPDGSYGPTRPVTRDQMAVYVSRTLAHGDSNVPRGPAKASFHDVPTSYWAFKYIEYAKTRGVVQGYPGGLYEPSNVVARDQMSVFLARAVAGSDSLVPAGPATASFPDVPTSYWSYKDVEYLKSLGVVEGYADGDYHPEYTCARGIRWRCSWRGRSSCRCRG